MRKLGCALFTIAILLSDVMCAHVAYVYRGMLCGIEHLGYSAPAGIAFLIVIPYLIGIVACVIGGTVLIRKWRKRKAE